MIGPVITVPSFAMTKDGVDHFFGTKHSRVGATAGAASDLKNGRDARARLISVKQVHGTDVLILDRPVREGQSFDGAWDALMTNQPGIMVAVRTADCVPVLLHDPVRRIVAAVHAGWRGAVAGIVPNTIAAMNARFGGEAAALRMAIGPSVGACCYEVDEPVLSKLRHAFPDPAASSCQWSGRTQYCSGQCLHDVSSQPLFFLPPRGRGEEYHGQWHCVGPSKLILLPQFCTVPMPRACRDRARCSISSVWSRGAAWGTNGWLLGSGR